VKQPRDWESWIDQQIREAQERGAFEDLPGKGAPLDLTSNPYARDQELAFKILRDAGYAPEWIELDKAIRGRLERARTTIRRQWEGHQARMSELEERSDRWAVGERDRSLSSWGRAALVFEEEVAAINKEIADLNLKVPGPRFQRVKVDAAQELANLKDSVKHETMEQERMAETVRLVVTRRERGPRSPRMERALKRLIWRYTQARQTPQGSEDAEE
jgi:DnaJ family protein C protein 28